jgi:hypothetical protein
MPMSGFAAYDAGWVATPMGGWIEPGNRLAAISISLFLLRVRSEHDGEACAARASGRGIHKETHGQDAIHNKGRRTNMKLKQPGLALAVAALACMVPASASAQLPDYDDYDAAVSEHQWIASGQIGSTFGESAEDASVGVGGTLTYLREGLFGAEVLGGVTPDLNLAQAPSDDSTVANFMVNGVAALPLEFDGPGTWQPFVSAGIGAMTISSDFLGASADVLNIDETQLGGNIGFGIMAFGERWGVRSDVRYFAGLGSDEGDATGAEGFLSDVDFWRANVGVAYQW